MFFSSFALVRVAVAVVVVAAAAATRRRFYFLFKQKLHLNCLGASGRAATLLKG